MAQSYSYTKQITPDVLLDEISLILGITPSFINYNINNFNIEIFFENALSAPNIIILDTIVSNYVFITEKDISNSVTTQKSNQFIDNFMSKNTTKWTYEEATSGITVSGNVLTISNPASANTTNLMYSKRLFEEGFVEFHEIIESSRVDNSGFLIQIIDKSTGSDATAQQLCIGLNAVPSTQLPLTTSDEQTIIRINSTTGQNWDTEKVTMLPATRTTSDGIKLEIQWRDHRFHVMVNDELVATLEEKTPIGEVNLHIQIKGVTGTIAPISGSTFKMDAIHYTEHFLPWFFSCGYISAGKLSLSSQVRCYDVAISFSTGLLRRFKICSSQ